MADGFDGDFAGWAYKQGSLVRNWKKRFLVLRGKQLTYYDTQRITSKTKEKGSFQVITVELSTEIQNGLLVHGRGGRVLKLYTDNAESTSAWYNAILDATLPTGASERMSLAPPDRFSMLSTGRRSSSGSGLGSGVDIDDEIELMERMESMPIEDAGQVAHSGWLKKQGNMVKSWKRRYFTLRGNALSYFHSEDTGTAAKGYGHVVAVEVSADKDNSLDIKFDNGRVLRVTAKTASDMEEWLCKLSDAIESIQLENNNVRQSIAARNSMRMSMAKPPMMPPRPLTNRRSLQSIPSDYHSEYNAPRKSNVIDRRLTSDSSYATSYSHADSYPENLSTIETESEKEQYLSEDDDSDDSEGDWI